MILDAAIAALVLAGAFFTLSGSIGLVRFPDFFMRLHGPTKTTTLGVGSLLIASAIYFSRHDARLSLRELLIMLFLFMTAPVSAHLMAKAALHLRVHGRPPLPIKRLSDPGWRGAERPSLRRHADDDDEGGGAAQPSGARSTAGSSRRGRGGAAARSNMP